MKILKLVAANIKRLSVVEITPDGNLIRIAGKNDQGKSSLLDTIAFALAGEKAIEWEPIKRGEEGARITLDLGDSEGLALRVTRKFTTKSGEKGSKPYATTLIVEDAEGRRPKGPQALLDTIVGAIAFDPLEFARAEGKAQVSLLRRLVPGVDFDAIAERRKQAYEDRTLANRRANEAKTRASGIIVPPNAPAEPINVVELSNRLAVISEQEGAAQREAMNRERMVQGAEALMRRAAEIKAEAETLQEELRDIDKKMADFERAKDTWPSLPEPEDRAPLVAEINMAAELNAAYARAQQKEQILSEAIEFEGKAREYAAAIEEADADVAKAIEQAELPVRGLRFDSEGVYLNDLPFSQAASSHQLRASMAIAMAMNPKLRVLRIKEGALLDEEAMQILAEVAAADDWQLWVERVEDDSPSAIQIEDGRVKA